MKYRILVIDDGTFSGTIIPSALEQGGHTFKIVKNANEAASLIQDYNPHALLGLLETVESPGTGLFETLRLQTTAPLIIACSRDVYTEAERRLGSEVSDFIELPCPPERILRVVRNAMERWELQETGNRLSSIEKSFQQTEKMATLGSLITGVAHEINTPVASINVNNDVTALEFAKLEEVLKQHIPAGLLENGGELHNIFETIRESIKTNRLACKRILTIVKALKGFAREELEEIQRIDLHDIIETALLLTSYELKSRIGITREFGRISEIECYPHRLSQVFINILLNAAQAIEGKGEILIRTCMERDSVHVEISDSGPGIPAGLLSRIFEPGFTTKTSGTGHGLFLCRQIIEDHNGRIEVSIEPEKGTTFKIVLPIKRQE
jgi:signal transduction histidine kinase